MRPSRRVIASVVVAALAVCGCSADPAASTPSGSVDGSASPSSPAPAASTPSPTTESEPTMPNERTVRMRVGEQTYTVALYDSPTADDFLAQLPLTLTLNDYGGQEKTAKLPKPLTMEGVPAGAAPEAGEIGYYRPNQVLVLWYSEIGYWDGIVRLGRVDGGLDSIIDVKDGTTVVIEATA